MGGLALAEVAAPVRSTAVDLMRAAELVAGGPEALTTEELLLMPAPVEETPWVLTFSEPEESSGKAVTPWGLLRDWYRAPQARR